MNEKPEALRLAQELYAFHAAKKEMPSIGGQMLGLESYRIVTTREVFSQILDAADKLLRQHAEIERLKAENERLREALRTALDASWNGPMPDYARNEATAALQEVPR